MDTIPRFLFKTSHSCSRIENPALCPFNFTGVVADREGRRVYLGIYGWRLLTRMHAGS
jgi:hypothetical protein